MANLPALPVTLGAWVMRPDQDFEPLLSELVKSLPGVVLAVSITQQDPDCAQRPTGSASLHTLDYIRTARVPVTAPSTSIGPAGQEFAPQYEAASVPSWCRMGSRHAWKS